MNPENTIEQMYRPGDEDALHFGAFLNHEIVGVVSFFEEVENNWRIRGMAVDPAYQKRGIGRKLVLTGCKELQNATLIWCNSRISAIAFYEKLGFVQKSDVLNIEGHGKRVKMELQSKN